jgi:hypothetical protein
MSKSTLSLFLGFRGGDILSIAKAGVGFHLPACAFFTAFSDLLSNIRFSYRHIISIQYTHGKADILSAAKDLNATRYSPPLWFDPDLSGFRSELRNSTSFGTTLLFIFRSP